MERKNNDIQEIVDELKLTEEQLKDKQIRLFVMSVLKRKLSENWFQYWNGNGYCELNKENGTMITTVLTDDDFKAEFPLNCDMNISTVCTNNCSFCYEGCSPEGKHADIKKFLNDKNSFLYSLHEGTELALNGNEPLHPDLELLLQFCKERNIMANLTVQENTLIKHKEQIENWLDNKLIHGIGISPCGYSDEMIEFVEKHPTAVIHTIAGITTMKQYEMLMDKNIKILILGYKNFGKGLEYNSIHHIRVEELIKELSENVKNFTKHFKVVSFDNLAIEQLNPKSFLTEEEWNKFYRGDDGHHTLYIDLVRETFAKNSVQARQNHRPIKSDIKEMLRDVQEIK